MDVTIFYELVGNASQLTLTQISFVLTLWLDCSYCFFVCSTNLFLFASIELFSCLVVYIRLLAECFLNNFFVWEVRTSDREIPLRLHKSIASRKLLHVLPIVLHSNGMHVPMSRPTTDTSDHLISALPRLTSCTGAGRIQARRRFLGIFQLRRIRETLAERIALVLIWNAKNI